MFWLSETWLRNKNDARKLGYCLNRNGLHLSCTDGDNWLAKRGGGLAITVKDTVKCCDLDKGNKITFDSVTLEVWSRGNEKPLILVGINHQPPSENNIHTTQIFINEFMEFYVELAVKFKNIVFLVDFNTYVNRHDN